MPDPENKETKEKESFMLPIPKEHIVQQENGLARTKQNTEFTESQEQQLIPIVLKDSHVKIVGQNQPKLIMKITISHWRLIGSAVFVIISIMVL
jgi:hypothetical protein